MKAFLKKDYPKILLAVSALVLLMRAFCGFCWSDESFYYSIAYRFLQGGVPFYEEWYPTQLNSIFLLPFVALYRLIAGSNDGMLLTFRILYVLVSVAVACMAYAVLKKETDRFTALFSALLFLYYTHLNIITFSYYAVSVLSAVFGALCILRYLRLGDEGKKSCRYLVFSGISCAVLVLSMPLMAIAYFAAVIVVLLILGSSYLPQMKENIAAKIRSLHLLRMLLYHLAGILAVAVPFFLWLFSKLSVSVLIQSLPYLLSDEEHDETTMYVALRNCFSNLSATFGKIIYLCYLLLLLSLVLRILRTHAARKKKEAKSIRVFEGILFFSDCAVFVLLFLRSAGHTGYVQIALVLFALPLFLLQEDLKDRLFLLFVLPGACISYCYIYTSSGYSVYTEAIGFAVACIWAPVMIVRYAGQAAERLFPSQTGKGRLLLFSFAYGAVISALLLTITLRLVNIYRDDSLSTLTRPLKGGPAAGIFTSEAHFTDYETVLSVISENCRKDSYPGDTHTKLLITKLLPWGYLCTDMSCASFSSWRSAMDSAQLKTYYDLHPDLYPDVILVLDPHYGSYETCGDVEADPLPNENDPDGHLFRFVQEHHYTEKSVPCGTLYVKP